MSEQNQHINPKLGKLKPQLEPDVEALFAGLRNGDLASLAQSITLVESTLKVHEIYANELITKCLPFSDKAIRIGITGVPGVGKSTFIEAFGTNLINQGHKVAVLAIDPSSNKTGGSILGDKTRMINLSNNPKAFIRPSPSAGSLGGVAQKTRESMVLLEAAGFDVILIETVGVGQSETAVHAMVDFFLLLMLAGAGDELQGIKRGIMEMADAIIINKAEGDNLAKAKIAAQEYKNALHLFPANPSGWIPKVQLCSALQNTGIAEIWEIINSYINHTKVSGYFEQKRKEQAQYWFEESLRAGLLNLLYTNNELKSSMEKASQEVSDGKSSPFVAAKRILESLRNLRV